MSENRPSSRAGATTRRRKSPVIPLVIAAVAAIALVAALARSFLADGGDVAAAAGDPSSNATIHSETRERAPERTWEILTRREPGDPMAVGDPDAPVVMISYSEFQCPFCGKFARDTEPELVEDYVDEGILRIEWRDFPYLGPESMTAAEGGRAAAAQGKFWEFHDAMYVDQLPPNSGNLDAAYLSGIAEDVGLDVDTFQRDMASKATQEGIARDFSEGQQIGVTGTPAFVINGIPVIGAQPTEVFRETIEQAADEAGTKAGS